MAGSPSESSSATSPQSASSEPRLLLLSQPPEADAFSDDSGVDVKPTAIHGRREDDESSADRRRHKRKSSEPKRRKDVLLMKRFRWEDTDEEDARDFEPREEDDEDPFDVRRPRSGDSGCTLDSPQDDRTSGGRPSAREEEDLPSGRRQSVIRKNEAAAETPTSCTDAPLHGRDDARPNSRPAQIGTGEDVPEDDGRGIPRRDPEVVRCGGGRPRNYKSMSRQRRIEANARERTRVHTISAAFESLRRAVPAYAHNQKLSKLAILRIASAYIVALACLNGKEDGDPSSSVSECVQRCTRTLQAEGRSRRRTSKE